MARGRRSDRSGRSSSGRVEPAGAADRPAEIETVEFEELPAGPGAMTPTATTGSASDDTQRTDAMAQPEETIEPVPGAESEPLPAAPEPQPRRGGFLPGLLGGLLGGAAVVGGGGWLAYDHGPIKPALERLDSTAAAAKDANSGIASLGTRLDELGKGLNNELGTLKDTFQQSSTAGQQALDQTKTAADHGLQQAEGEIAQLGGRLDAVEKTNADMITKVDQAANTFRAASEQVISRLEAVNAKLVEVEQHQPADVVDKQTVADLVARQGSIEQGQKDVAAALARAEQMVSQSLEAGYKQATALQSMVEAARTRMEEISTQQQTLLGMKDQLATEARTNQDQAAALAAATQQLAALQADLQSKVEGARSELQQQVAGAKSELQQKVEGTRTELQQQLADTSAKLSTEGAERERTVGLSLATNSLDASLQNGQSFEPTITTLRQLGKDDQVVTDAAAKLEPMAASGIPTFAALAQGLDAIEQGLSAKPAAGPSDWLARTTANLNNLIDLHPADQETVPGQSAVRAAKQALLLQDLAGAAAALKPLADQGNEAAKAWIASADQRLAAAEAVDSLRQHLKTMLARQG